MTFPHLAIQSNNWAASLIERGESPNAIRLLASVLKSLEEQKCDEVASNNDKGCPQAAPQALDQCIINVLETQSTDDLSVADNVQFVHKRPIYIPLSLASQSNFTTHIILPIIFFNTALAHNLLAIDCLDEAMKTELLLKKSLRLYEIAYRCNPGSTFFVIAIANNLGTIHNNLKNKQATRKYFTMLLSVLMFILTSVEAEEKGDRKPCLNAFLFNALSFLYNSSSAPAA